MLWIINDDFFKLLQLKWTSEVLGSSFLFTVLLKTFPDGWDGNTYGPCSSQRLFFPVSVWRILCYWFNIGMTSICTTSQRCQRWMQCFTWTRTHLSCPIWHEFGEYLKKWTRRQLPLSHQTPSALWTNEFTTHRIFPSTAIEVIRFIRVLFQTAEC